MLKTTKRTWLIEFEFGMVKKVEFAGVSLLIAFFEDG